MTDHNEDIYLREMLDHALEACQLVESHDRSLLDTDRVMSLAVVRLLEIVGEAASRVSSDRRQQLPDIPWSQIVGMRNILIHAYHSVDHNIVWDVLKTRLPKLIQELERLDLPEEAE